MVNIGEVKWKDADKTGKKIIFLTKDKWGVLSEQQKNGRIVFYLFQRLLKDLDRNLFLTGSSLGYGTLFFRTSFTARDNKIYIPYKYHTNQRFLSRIDKYDNYWLGFYNQYASKKYKKWILIFNTYQLFALKRLMTQEKERVCR